MKVTCIALVAVLSLAAGVIELGERDFEGKSPKFTSCGKGSMTINDVTISPYPMRKGKDVTITANGFSGSAITDGHYEVSVSFIGMEVTKKHGNPCKDFDGLECPAAAGPVSASYTVKIPESAPAGAYKIKLSAVDQDKNDLFCISMEPHIKEHTPLVATTNAAHDESIINYVNTHPKATWSAAPSKRWEGSSMDDVAAQCGLLAGGPVLPTKVFPHTFLQALTIPESFDAREEWGSKCPSLHEVRDQGNCGSCWAVAAAEAMTDRMCIASGGSNTVRLSEEDLVSCCGFMCGQGCNGGYPSSAWGYFARTGLVSGGAYGSEEGCYPYEVAPCSHHVSGKYPACAGETSTPSCARSCQNGASWSGDKHKGTSSYSVHSDQAQIQAEIMQHGPVEAGFTVYEDFPSYSSGVYQHMTGRQLGGHAVKVVGWGVEDSTPYWLVANSWNSDWGDKGYFKIARGNDECGIESGIVAGLA